MADQSLTVVCVLVRANVPYGTEYVWNLKRMVDRRLKRPHRFVCLTNVRRYLMRNIECIRIKHDPTVPGWWAKMELWNPAHGLTGRLLYLDLDTLLVSALDPIVDFHAPFALIPDRHHYQPSSGKQVVHRFNSSVMVWDAGVNDHLYARFSPDVVKRLHGDQDFIGEQCPDAATMPLEWFPRLSELQGQPAGPQAKVVLAKVPKNAEAARRWRWFDAIWRAA